MAMAVVKIVISSMARTIFKAKTSPVNHAATRRHPLMLPPTAAIWTPGAFVDGLEKDLPPGEELLANLRPFIEHLASSSLSPKTIRRHVDNLWLLVAKSSAT